MNTHQIGLIREDCARVASDPSAFQALKGESVFITGGTGFIGCWVTELLTYFNDAHGYGINIHLLAQNAYNLENLAPHLATHKSVRLISCDVRSDFDIPNNCRWVIHLAGTPDNRVHASDPLGVVDCIVNGTNQALRSATRLPDLRKFLNVSSGLIYGSQPWELETIPESYSGNVDCSSASSAYAEAKRMAETLCHIYRTQFQLPVVNARPFAFVGPYQFAFSGPYHLLERPWAINNFIHRAFEGGPIRITCDEETVRSYMYPSDMAHWLLKMLADGRTGMTFNLGSPQGFTLRQVAEAVAEDFPDRPEIEAPAPNRNLVRSKFVPDVSRAQRYLGLDVTVPFDEAIKRTIHWIRSATGPVEPTFSVLR